MKHMKGQKKWKVIMNFCIPVQNKLTQLHNSFLCFDKHLVQGLSMGTSQALKKTSKSATFIDSLFVHIQSKS